MPYDIDRWEDDGGTPTVHTPPRYDNSVLTAAVAPYVAEWEVTLERMAS